MKNKKIILTLVANQFLVFVGIGLVVPVVPYIKDEMGLSGSVMGFMMALFSVAQFIVSPFVGRASDRLGRKKMIVAGMLLYAISEFIFGFATNVNHLYLSRIFGGISAAMIMPTVMSFASDETEIEERSKVMGWMSAAISGGFIIGPGIGGVLGLANDRLPFFVAGILGLFGFLFAQLFLRESSRFTNGENELANVEKGDWKIVLQKKYLIPFMVILVASFGLAGFEGIYSVFVHDVYGFTMNDISVIMVVSGVLALVFQVFLFERMIIFLGEVGLIRICYFLSGLGVLSMLVFDGRMGVFLGTFVVFLAFDLIRPAISTYISKQAGTNQGLMNGMNSSLTSIGNIIGPLMSGILLDINPRYPYISVVLFLALAFVITLFWKAEIVQKRVKV